MITDHPATTASNERDIELGIMHEPEVQEANTAIEQASFLPTWLFIKNIAKLTFAPENRLAVITAMGLSIVTTAFNLLAPALYSETVQTLNNDTNARALEEELSLEELIGIFVAVSAASQLMANLTSLVLSKPTANITQKIVIDCIEHQLKKSLNYYMQAPTRKHTNHIDNGFIAGVVVFPSLMTLMPTLIQIALADTYFFSRYGLEMGFSIPVLVIANIVYGAITAGPVMMLGKEANDAGNEVRENMTEMIKSYKTMRDFCKYDFTTQQFMHVMSKWITLFQKLQAIEPKANIGQVILVSAHMFWVAWHIGSRVKSGEYSTQDFMIAIGYLQALSLMLPAFGKMIVQTIAFTPIANAVFRELEQPDEVIDAYPEYPFPSQQTAPEITFDNLTYYLPQRPNDTARKLAFSNLSFTIRSGSRVGVVTESGVGKTTLFNLIYGYDKPTKGEIRINNTSIQQMSLKALQENITIFEQNPTLFKGSIRDNICYGAPNPDDVTDEMIWELARKSQLDEFLKKFSDGLNTDVGESGRALSSGEKQKIALLRCLFKETRIWLLDEVTASLDAATANEFISTLYESSVNVTCFMTNHKLQEMKQFVDDMIVIDKEGKIVGQGTHEQLLETCQLYIVVYG